MCLVSQRSMEPKRRSRSRSRKKSGILKGELPLSPAPESWPPSVLSPTAQGQGLEDANAELGKEVRKRILPSRDVRDQ